jgi:hypothetical protein
VVRVSLLRTRQRCAAVPFSTDSSNLDGREFRARVRIDSAGASRGAKDILDVVVLTRKAPVVYYHEGARRRQARHSALCQRLAWTYGVSLRRQPGSRGDHQEPYVLFPTADERVASLDGIVGTTRHSFAVSIYPQRAQPGRHLFKADRPRRVDVVALCSSHDHVASASSVPQEYLARCLRLSTVKSDISLRLQTLRSRGIGRGWTLARLKPRSRLVEPAVDVVARRSLQAPCGASGSCAHSTSMVVANVVAVTAHSRNIPRRAAAAKVQCLASTQRKNEALPQHGRPATSSLLSSWRQTMTRRTLIDCTLGPLQRHAERLLWAGRRESTKVSYSGKWMRFVNFCTLTLPSEYGMILERHSRLPCRQCRGKPDASGR